MGDKLLMIDSKNYPDQNTNDLTVYLDKELRNVAGLRIIYAGIPCTFYNISRELGNNYFAIDDDSGYKYLTVPDGFYDVASFNKEFSNQMDKMGYGKYGISFDVQESTGKIEITFRKRIGKTFKLAVSGNNAELLGFTVPKGRRIELPRTTVRKHNDRNKTVVENPAIGDVPINFKPFESFHIHCDLIDTEDVLYNGKKSDILVRVPVKKCDFGEMITYYLTGLRDRKCDQSFNKIRLWITDETDNPIDFKGANIQYELLFRFSV